MYYEEEKDWEENNRNTSDTDYFKIAQKEEFSEEVINAIPPSLLMWKYLRYLNACSPLSGLEDPLEFLNCYLSDYLLMPANKEKEEFVSNQTSKNLYDIED